MDTIPNTFLFPQAADVPPGTKVASAPVTIAGLGTPSNASASEGVLLVNGKPAVQPAFVQNGDTLAVELTASALYDDAVSSVVAVGDYRAAFIVRTARRSGRYKAVAADTPLDLAFAADGAANRIARLDPSTGDVTYIPAVDGSGPQDAGEYLYVANHYAGSVYKVSPRTRAIVKTITGFARPFQAAATYDEAYGSPTGYSAPFVAVTDVGGQALRILANDVIQGSLPLASRPAGVCAVSDVYFVTLPWDDTLLAVRRAAYMLEVVGTLRLPSGSKPFAVKTDGSNVWATLIGSAQVARIAIDFSSHDLIDVQGGPFGLTLTGDAVYVANSFANTVSIIDVAASTVSHVECGEYPSFVVENASSVFVAGFESGAIEQYDKATRALVKTHATTGPCYGLTVDASGNVWSASYYANTPSVMVAPDLTPDAFADVDIGLKARDSVVVQDLTVSGLSDNRQVKFYVPDMYGAAFSLNGVPAGRAAFAKNGDKLALKFTLPHPYDIVVDMPVSIGAQLMYVKTGTMPRLAPDQFVLETVVDAFVGHPLVSNTVTLAGISDGYDAPLTLSGGGAFVVNGQVRTETTISVRNGDTLAIAYKPYGPYGTQSLLTVANQYDFSVQWSVTTLVLSGSTTYAYHRLGTRARTPVAQDAALLVASAQVRAPDARLLGQVSASGAVAVPAKPQVHAVSQAASTTKPLATAVSQAASTTKPLSAVAALPPAAPRPLVPTVAKQAVSGALAVRAAANLAPQAKAVVSAASLLVAIPRLCRLVDAGRDYGWSFWNSSVLQHRSSGNLEYNGRRVAIVATAAAVQQRIAPSAAALSAVPGVQRAVLADGSTLASAKVSGAVHAQVSGTAAKAASAHLSTVLTVDAAWRAGSAVLPAAAKPGAELAARHDLAVPAAAEAAVVWNAPATAVGFDIPKAAVKSAGTGWRAALDVRPAWIAEPAYSAPLSGALAAVPEALRVLSLQFYDSYVRALAGEAWGVPYWPISAQVDAWPSTALPVSGQTAATGPAQQLDVSGQTAATGPAQQLDVSGQTAAAPSTALPVSGQTAATGPAQQLDVSGQTSAIAPSAALAVSGQTSVTGPDIMAPASTYLAGLSAATGGPRNLDTTRIPIPQALGASIKLCSYADLGHLPTRNHCHEAVAFRLENFLVSRPAFHRVVALPTAGQFQREAMTGSQVRFGAAFARGPGMDFKTYAPQAKAYPVPTHAAYSGYYDKGYGEHHARFLRACAAFGVPPHIGYQGVGAAVKSRTVVQYRRTAAPADLSWARGYQFGYDRNFTAKRTYASVAREYTDWSARIDLGFLMPPGDACYSHKVSWFRFSGAELSGRRTPTFRRAPATLGVTAAYVSASYAAIHRPLLTAARAGITPLAYSLKLFAPSVPLLRDNRWYECAALCFDTGMFESADAAMADAVAENAVIDQVRTAQTPGGCWVWYTVDQNRSSAFQFVGGYICGG